MDRTMDSISPANSDTSSGKASFLYRRDSSILVSSQRPATKILHKKNEEILRLQKEVKTMLQSTVNDKIKMEKEFKKVLKELGDKKQEIFHMNQTIWKLQQIQISNSEVLQKIIEDRENEILKMKNENKSLEIALNLKEEDMKKLKQDRDEILTKYHELLENMQEFIITYKKLSENEEEELKSLESIKQKRTKNYHVQQQLLLVLSTMVKNP
ncbi:hypothetical protein PV327_005305 [Microctonus hyperodae]|uniref:Uncharacterized protein n=1 Tax=Microctonus hyperodae TaxID=165561 RepID=A0AA39G132_MICHY|nr:hypothetical protein PV327_005305 [Microctonus hyperodae]